ncbi:MAG: hypothetical protein MJZ64_00300 [Paludibacteraceae bacterium]|nr:hypothetical protein [Paludibacteraceae bacterium]
MTFAKNMKVFRDAQELTKTIVQIERNLPLDMKVTLGRDCIRLCGRILVSIKMVSLRNAELKKLVDSNDRDAKIQEIAPWWNEYNTCEDLISAYMDVCLDDKNTRKKVGKREDKYIELLSEIGKQMNRWRKSIEA